jgi:succinate dehydrogenase flavin-adding protein (antitoxin of CptAB toxin-antitoxin module)
MRLSDAARRGKRGLTIYLNPIAHAELKSIAEDEDKQLKDLLEEGVNLVLARSGRKPIA